MKTEHFLWDNGAGYHTRLWRYEVTLVAFPRRTEWVWRDAPPGHEHAIELDDEDGWPVDDFGLRVKGNFIEPSIK